VSYDCTGDCSNSRTRCFGSMLGEAESTAAGVAILGGERVDVEVTAAAVEPLQHVSVLDSAECDKGTDLCSSTCLGMVRVSKMAEVLFTVPVK